MRAKLTFYIVLQTFTTFLPLFCPSLFSKLQSKIKIFKRKRTLLPSIYKGFSRLSSDYQAYLRANKKTASLSLR
nr:MAG TPA: hypothetical protein [Caudoviricetes sp.]